MPEKDYYRRVKTAILYSKEYNNLMGKAETGEEVSQYATVDLASTLSECMAEELGYNSQKTAVLTMCKGMLFSPYGQAGMKYIEQLAEKEDTHVDKQKVCKLIVDRILSDNKFEMTKELEEGIDDLFIENVSDNESKIVNVVYKILEDILVLRESSISMQTKLNNRTFDIIEDSINESKRVGEISTSPKLEELKTMERFKQEKDQLTEEQKGILDQLWQGYKVEGLTSQEIVTKIITEQER